MSNYNWFELIRSQEYRRDEEVENLSLSLVKFDSPNLKDIV
jgi:hypothetical protein